MKIRNLFFYVIGAATLMFTTQCEGPAGEDGHVTCLKCHSEDQILTVQVQFKQSQHKSGEIAVAYAGGRESCARCHSHEGFLNYAFTGEVDGDVSGPQAWECSTCHKIHETFEESFEGPEYTLRLADPVAFIFDTAVVADLGTGNLCANCHQSRRAEPNIDAPGAKYEITSTHYGPHHGAQANVVWGAGFAELGSGYAEPGSHPHAGAGCTGCHMGSYGENEEEGFLGGHTFKPVTCNECHSSADANYDFAGVQEEVEGLLVELRDLLLDQGVLAADTADDESVSYHPVTAEFDMAQVQAFFNWVGLEEDRSKGAHNPKYVKTLLENTIAEIE